MRVEPNQQISLDDGRLIKHRGFGFTWYQGVAIVFDVWNRRISWSPWWVRIERKGVV